MTSMLQRNNIELNDIIQGHTGFEMHHLMRRLEARGRWFEMMITTCPAIL